VLRIVLPKGSLERATLELFEAADLTVIRSSAVEYRATIDDPRVDEVRILRPQEIPMYVAEGLFDLGVTGRDWVEETASDVISLGELRYSKATSNPVRVVVAVAEDSPAQKVSDLPQGVRVSSEYPELTRRYFAGHGIDADVRLSYGASEAKVPDIADCVVDITETGRALRAAGLRVIDTILSSYTEVVANPASHADPAKRHAMGQLMTLLNGSLEAREKVLLKLNVPAESFEAVLAVLPSAKSPTVSELAGGSGFAVESLVEKRQINLVIPALKEAGATDLLEIPIAKIVH
jgi:ATP phosphoribosyltransferase